MKWILIVLGVIVLAGILMAAVGAMLPVKHHATRKARFHQSAPAIYAIISGPPDWRPDVKASGKLPDANGHRQWWEQDSHGRKITFEEIENTPSRFVTRIAGGENGAPLPFGGIWSIEIAPISATETEVRVTEDGEVYNVVFRFLSRFVFGQTGSIEAYLRNLGAKFGEQPASEA
jgi:hypothetical protein